MGKLVFVVLSLCCVLVQPLVVLAQAQPGADETALYATAQSTGAATDYQAYLSAYPNGAYAEAAQFELQWAGKSEAVTSASAAPAPETTITAPGRAQPAIGFTTPLVAAGSPVDGKSIADLIQGTPSFPPIDGIPESLWKDKPCASCHHWTKEALCAQGATYTQPKGEAALAKKHPYGGAFKAALKTFALSGCT